MSRPEVAELKLAKANQNTISWIRHSLSIAALVISVLVAWAYLRFGSLTIALGYAGGQRLFVENASQDFGQVGVGQAVSIDFNVINLSKRVITIVGARSSCTCAVPEGLPLRLDPGTTGLVRVRVNTNGKSGPVAASVPLYTQGPAGADVALEVRGFVDSSDSEPQTPGKHQ